MKAHYRASGLLCTSEIVMFDSHHSFKTMTTNGFLTIGNMRHFVCTKRVPALLHFRPKIRRKVKEIHVMLGSTKGVLGNDIHCLCKPKTWTSRRLPDSRRCFPVPPNFIFDIQRVLQKNVTSSRKRRLLSSDRILDGFIKTSIIVSF
jgi:hypothetical protein